MNRIWLLTFLFIFTSADAALINRGEGFIYDDVLNVTWTQNASINGSQTWANQVAWADNYSQTHSMYGTFDDWRLPTTGQPDPTCNQQVDPGGGFPLQGVGYECTGSEMGHLFTVDGVSEDDPGPFTNLQYAYYWSGTEYAPDTDLAWSFFFVSGLQDEGNKAGSAFYALAVRDGDIANVVPVPAAVWLFVSGLLGLFGMARRKRAA
jgi:hypothetical protein